MKNDDATLYLASAAAKKCRLCDKTYKRMVNHFRRDHPNYEVFVSRLSPQTASELKRSNPFMTKYARASGMQYLKMMCPFCEDEKDFFFSYWTNHIRTHTGEYTNECIVCNKISLNATHCGQATIKQKCRLLDEGLSAYLCNRCNWIQISEERVKAHVRIQHGDAGAYQKVVLIPALNRIKAHVVPSNALPQRKLFLFAVSFSTVLMLIIEHSNYIFVLYWQHPPNNSCRSLLQMIVHQPVSHRLEFKYSKMLYCTHQMQLLVPMHQVTMNRFSTSWRTTILMLRSKMA